jgi:hypothetical protein
MDEAEQLANLYLCGLNLGPVVFEPDGNIPPDFSVGGHIGAEVRRLNQNFVNPDGLTEGLEEVSVPLWQRLRSLFHSLGPSVNGECWYVSLDYRRPLGRWKPLEAKIRLELRAFMRASVRTRMCISISPNLTLDLHQAGKDHGTFFRLGASADADSGGWVMAEVEKNLRFCIAEKEKKIAPYRERYEEWWLVLADHIDYSMETSDREVFRTTVMPNITHSFQRIVFIDPRDHRRSFAVSPTGPADDKWRG